MTVSNSTGKLTDHIFGIGERDLFSAGDPSWDSWRNVSVTPPSTGIVWEQEGRSEYEKIKKMVEAMQSNKATGERITLVKSTLRFKGVVFVITLEKEILQFFEDEKNISSDEMRLIECTYPEEYKRIKEAWMKAWKDLQASRAFDEY